MKQRMPALRWFRNLCPALAAAIIFLGVLFAVGAAWAVPTDLQKVHTQYRRKPSFTQLVFFFKGSRPRKLIASTSADEYLIDFQNLTTKLKLEQTTLEPASTVRAITISKGHGSSSRLHIHYRQPHSVAKAMILPATPPRQGFYRLAVNVFPPIVLPSQPTTSTPPPAAAAPSPGAPMPVPPEPSVSSAPPAPAPGSTVPLSPSLGIKVEEAPQIEYLVQISKEEEGVRAGLGEGLQQANRAYDQGDYQKAFELYDQFIGTSPSRKDERAAAWYGLADSHFALNEKRLADAAVDIIANYAAALKADPAGFSAPWAMYRSGLALEILENFKKAKEYFEQVATQFPKHPAAPLSLLELSRQHIQRKSYGEAIQVLRKVLAYPLEKPLRTSIYRQLGEALYSAGEQARSIEAFTAAMDTDPDLFLKEPTVLRYLGEAYFVEQQYDKSRDLLFRYLNLISESADRDLVLARIAEIFTIQDEKDLANKLYAYIQNTYPNSEGDVIAKIRRAEYLEGKDKITVDDAAAIYHDLLQKPLAAPLSRLVHFKFALRQFERGNFTDCVKILDESLQDNLGKAPSDDFIALRSKAILGWVRQAYQHKDHAQLVQLYENNSKVFSTANSIELDTMVAESYANLKLFTNAIRLAQNILARKGTPKDEELVLKIADFTFQAGDITSALQWCDQVLAPGLLVEKNKLLARILFAQRQYPKVIELLNRLPDKDKASANPVNWYGLYAETYLQMGDCEKAVAGFDKALEVLGNDPGRSADRMRIFMNQQICYRKLNNIEKAVACLEAASSLASSEELRCQFQYELARLYQEAGQTEKATRVLTKLLESPISLWQTAARQELDYLRLQQAAKTTQ